VIDKLSELFTEVRHGGPETFRLRITRSIPTIALSGEFNGSMCATTLPAWSFATPAVFATVVDSIYRTAYQPSPSWPRPQIGAWTEYWASPMFSSVRWHTQSVASSSVIDLLSLSSIESLDYVGASSGKSRADEVLQLFY
jgi:hypothetical protein